MGYKHVFDLWEQTFAELVSPAMGPKITGWDRFNHFIGGLRSHELTLLCAPTGAGKTALLANLTARLAFAKVPVFAAPIETGDCDFVKRVLSAIDQRDYNSGDPLPTSVAESVFNRYTESFRKLPLYISTYSDRVSIEDMLAQLELMHVKHGVQVAVLDNLNFFLKVTRSQDERIEMDNAIHEFVIAVKRLPIHVILICHPRKTDGGRVESEFDIKGSSTAVQEAANVILFNRPSQEQLERIIINGNGLQFSDRELVFKKIRKRGMFVNKPIWFRFDGGSYSELGEVKK